MKQLLALDIACSPADSDSLWINAFSYLASMIGTTPENRPIGSTILVDYKQTTRYNKCANTTAYYLNGCINGNAIHPFQVEISHIQGTLLVNIDGLSPKDVVVLSTNKQTPVFHVRTFGRTIDTKNLNGFTVATIPDYDVAADSPKRESMRKTNRFSSSVQLDCLCSCGHQLTTTMPPAAPETIYTCQECGAYFIGHITALPETDTEFMGTLQQISEERASSLLEHFDALMGTAI